jgi:hypothetical protein
MNRGSTNTMSCPEDTITSKKMSDADFKSSDEEPNQATSELYFTKDGRKLFPQPVGGDVLDPLNWSSSQKHVILAIIMAL